MAYPPHATEATATATINLVVGVAIWCLIANVARTAVRRGAARTLRRSPGSSA
jgi:hypothetical protein